jgi:hypothetical protein
MDVNIFKYIPMSINKMIDDAGLGYDIFYEGQTHNIIQDQPSLHVYVIGPKIFVGGSENVLTIRLKIVVSVPENDQGYLIYLICGKLANILKDDIILYDDEYQAINCIKQFDEILINHYGKVNPDLPLKQSTVETQYKVYLLGD